MVIVRVRVCKWLVRWYSEGLVSSSDFVATMTAIMKVHSEF